MTPLGLEMHGFARELYPVCRSIAGPGLRETIRRVGERLPLAVREVPTGTPILDWTAPNEWELRAAWIERPDGSRAVDATQSNLHVVNYSVAVDREMSLEELRPHLHTVPDHHDWIPYRTSYHQPRWGFCLTQRQLEALGPGPFRVRIDAEHRVGSLTYGECLIPGTSPREVMITAHCCHPSLANDNLSGVVMATYLGRALAARPRRLSYRILFAPGTIGAIAWLAEHRSCAATVAAGLVVACVGDRGGFRYKRTRHGATDLDRAVAVAFRDRGLPLDVVPFSPLGYDERQFSSPGFDLPFGSLTRTSHGKYPEYHTSADNLELLDPAALEGSLEAYLAVLDVLDRNASFRNLSPFGEPQLGRRGLFRTEGGKVPPGDLESAYLWVLNASDGRQSLLDVAERSGLPFATVAEAADRLAGAGLLEAIGPGPA